MNRVAKIKLNETKDQLELIRAMGSRNKSVSLEAQEAFAAHIGPIAKEVLDQAGTAGMIYSDLNYNEDEDPSIPLDLFHDETEDFINTWSQTIAGGLATSQVYGQDEMKVATYTLDSAVSMLKKHARRAQLPLVEKALNRMAQTLLVKQEHNAWIVIMKVLAEAVTNSNNHVIRVNTAGQFVPDDLNKLMTRMRRINVSFANGTPSNFQGRMTDLITSPETKEAVRGFAYQPINTIGSQSNGPVTLPDNIREEFFRSAGEQEIYGVVITDLVELGTSQRYNLLFDNFAGSTSYAKLDGTSSATFTESSEEIAVALDLTRDAFIRALGVNAEGESVIAEVDDSFPVRSDLMGFFSHFEEGRICVDSRPVMGLVI